MRARHAVRLTAVLVVSLVIAVAGCSKSTTRGGLTQVAEASPAAPASSEATNAGSAAKAIAAARAKGLYAFVLFYKTGDSDTKAMRTGLDQAKKKLSAKAVFLTVDVTEKTDRALIEKYGIDRAPLPVVLALAPNGAVVKAFTKPVDEKALRDAFVSAKTSDMLKALQDGKLVALCVQGSKTQHNDESMKAARELVADPLLAGQAKVISVDPGSAAEKQLIEDCGLSPDMKEPTVILVAPPSSLVATVEGATTKTKLLDALRQGLAACGSGCGPSGCG